MTMRNGWLAKSVTMMLAVSGATGLLRAGDWPQWGGSDPGRNMVSTETGLPASFDAKGETLENVRWMMPLGSHIYGNPTVAGGRVFVGTDDALLEHDERFHRTRGGMVWCLEEATGRMLWRLVVGWWRYRLATTGALPSLTLGLEHSPRR